MAEVRSIRISTRSPTTGQAVVRQAIFWTMIVGVIGISRVWFGGAVVIDLVAVILGVLVLAIGAREAAGTTASMTRAEIRLWVAAGMPDDIAAWRAGAGISSAA